MTGQRNLGEVALLFDNFPATSPFDVDQTAEDLLLTREKFEDEWDVLFGGNMAFYVRGTTLFRRAAYEFDKVARLAKQIDRMKAHLRQMRGWGSNMFDWDSDFSHGQVRQAWDQKPRSFDKAAQVILLCAVAAQEAKHMQSNFPDGNAVMAYMKIEAAVYYIQDFTPQVLARIDSAYLDEVRKMLGQRDIKVFADMAAGLTVTWKLANGLRAALREDLPELDVGDVEIVTGKNFTVSENERIDPRSLPSASLPSPVA